MLHATTSRVGPAAASALRSRRSLASWGAVACLALLALGLRLYRVDHQSLWIDEVSSIEVAIQPLRDIIFNYRPGMHPDRGAEQAPLALAVMHFFLLADVSEAAARLPSVLLGVAGVLALYAFARRIVAAPGAQFAAALLALSPLHVWYSQEARWYAQWILLTVLSYWALLAAAETGRRRAWIAYWLCTVLNVYTFILSFLVVACQGISVLLLQLTGRAQRRAVPQFVLAQVLVLLACAPVLWMIVGTLGLGTGTPRPLGLAELPYTLFVYVAGYSAGPTTTFLHSLPGVREILSSYPSVMVFGVVFAPLLLLGLWRMRSDARAASILLPWCFGPLVLTYGVSLLSNVTYQARYSSAALPAFLLLITLGSLSFRERVLRTASMTAVLACCLWSLGNYYWNPDYGKEDVKDAVAQVEAAGLADAPVVVVGQVASAVAFYGPQLRVVPVERCADDSAAVELVGAVMDRSVWFLVGRDWDRRAPECLDQLRATHRVVERRRFPGVDLWLFGSYGDAASAFVVRRGDGVQRRDGRS